MKKLDAVSWREIYHHWHLYSSYGPSKPNLPITPIPIFVDFSSQNGVFYGYDWLALAEYDSRKATIDEDIVQFLYFTKPTNKGTMHTLNMLIHSVSDEERAAIWMYAFAKEISDHHGRGNIDRYACQLCDAAWGFLSQHFSMWHHAMKKLVPEVFIHYSIYSETEFNSINAVIELARINAAMVLHEYVPILYTSLKPDEEPPDISVRHG